MEIKELKREFLIKEGNTTLPDIDPDMTIEQVQQFYSMQYPQLTTATYTKEFKEDKWIITFKSVIGTKG